MFATLVSLITAVVEENIAHESTGRTKVIGSGHTLILGWNSATIRVVCQLAFIRRQFQQQNEGCIRRIFPWLRVSASTPCAASQIVLLNDTHTKTEMHELLHAGLSSRGIKQKRTKIGWDVICRVGNPCDVHDLIMVNAQEATSILIMLTDEDDADTQACAEASMGLDTEKLHNSASLTCLMALRHVLYSDQNWRDAWKREDNSRRIVVQTMSRCDYMQSIFTSPDGHPVHNSMQALLMSSRTDFLRSWCRLCFHWTSQHFSTP